MALRHAQLFAATQEQASRLQAVVETAVDAILMIDERGIVTMGNPAVERVFGYAPAEIIGQNVKVLMPAPYREEHGSYLARYRQTGERRIIGIGRQVVGQRRDGMTFPMDLAVSEMRVGERRMFAGIVHDLTAHVQMEAMLQQAHDALDERVYHYCRRTP